MENNTCSQKCISIVRYCTRWYAFREDLLVNGLINAIKVMSRREIYLNTLFLCSLSPLSGFLVLVHILSPETDNCLFLNARKGDHDYRNYFMTDSTKERGRTRRGANQNLLITSRLRISLSHRDRRAQG